MIDIDTLLKEIQTLNLLYVEDNEEARESALMLFNDLFDNIIVAIDGKDGLEKFQSNKIDLIITDLSMPEMDGLEMSKTIKQIDNNIPIIILSAITDISIMEKANNIGINCFINKPLDDIDILFKEFENIIIKKNG
ncbi:MAG: response regulator [Epsilonproteobacteria bacterium]|nr:MAG: response regulator [Campylobacterota bacterium]